MVEEKTLFRSSPTCLKTYGRDTVGCVKITTRTIPNTALRRTKEYSNKVKGQMVQNLGQREVTTIRRTPTRVSSVYERVKRCIYGGMDRYK